MPQQPGFEEAPRPTPQDAQNEPIEPSAAPELVRQTTIRVLKERIELLGVDRSGAYEHYNLLLTQGFPIPIYEIEILDFVNRYLPNLRSYHEIGSGLGTLPLMLAYDGFPAVGVERDQRRHLTATTILREVSAQAPHVESNCRLFGAEFPDAVADLDVSDSIAILTDFVSTQSPGEYVRVCKGLAQYRYVLLDLQRFCLKREGRDEQEQLVEQLAGCGLVPCSDVIDLGNAGCYQLFESTSREERRQVTEASAAPTTKTDAPASMELTPASAGELTAASASEMTVQPSALLGRVVLPSMPQRTRVRRFGGLLGLSALLAIGIPTLFAIAYYGFWASSQYVTTFQFAVRGPSQAGRPGGATLGLAGPSAMSPDSFVVTDYINSQQAVADVQRDLDLRAMFSKSGIDSWSRLPPNVTPEQMSAYWDKMVWAHFDLISGNVTASVRAFTPQESLNLAQALIVTSNEMFRRLNAQAQHDFVRLADENLSHTQKQLAAAQAALAAFREQSGLVDPNKTAQAGSSIVDDQRKQLAGLQAQYASIRATSPNSPSLAVLRSQIAALEGQIRSQGRDAGSPSRAVTPEALARYQSLDLDRQFAEKQYTEALGMRDQAYLTAQNQQSYLALFVEPTLAQTSLYPDRSRSIATVVLAAAAAWFVGMLLTYAVRDHLM